MLYRVIDLEIHTAEPLVPETSLLEFEIAIAKLKRNELPGIDKIPAELIQAGGETLCSEIHQLNSSIWNKEDFFLSSGSSLLL
jgi:hypothetical protein